MDVEQDKEETVLSGEDMLNELDLPSWVHVGFVKCTRDNFSKSLDILVNHFIEAAKVKKQTKSNPIIKLLYGRCITDLTSGFHLASHGYPNQFFSITRNILESLDLIDLFEKDEKEALRWLELEEDSYTRIKEFGPSAVRKKLGKPTYNEIYGHFCEQGSHPSFASFRSFTAVAVKEGVPNQIHIQLGSTDFVYPIVFSLGFAYLLLFSITVSLVKHLRLAEGETKRILSEQLTYMEKAFSECLRPELEKEKVKDTSLIDGILESMKEVKEKVEKTLQDKPITK